MGDKNFYSSAKDRDVQAVPFDSAEQTWFWFIEANIARNDGARFASKKGITPRPCEPIDVLKTLERLYRSRMLKWDHILVLNHYGKRLVKPDAERVKEQRSAMLWDQAMDRLETIFKRKGIVRDDLWAGFDLSLDLEAAE